MKCKTVIEQTAGHACKPLCTLHKNYSCLTSELLFRMQQLVRVISTVAHGNDFIDQECYVSQPLSLCLSAFSHPRYLDFHMWCYAFLFFALLALDWGSIHPASIGVGLPAGGSVQCAVRPLS